MNALLKVLLFLVPFQTSLAQRNPVKNENVCIINKVNNKSFSIGDSEFLLKGFNQLLKLDTMYIGVEEEGLIHRRELLNKDHFLRYRFKDIVVFVGTNHNVTTFSTSSPSIVLKVKSMFSISPVEPMSKIAEIFPEEIKKSRLIHLGKNDLIHKGERDLLCVNISLQMFIKSVNRYVDMDSEIVLLFDPKTKLLDQIDYWIAD